MMPPWGYYGPAPPPWAGRRYVTLTRVGYAMAGLAYVLMGLTLAVVVLAFAVVKAR